MSRSTPKVPSRPASSRLVPTGRLAPFWALLAGVAAVAACGPEGPEPAVGGATPPASSSVAVAPGPSSDVPDPPARFGPALATKVPVTDVYHGLSVVDDYRWLEDGKSKETHAFSESRSAFTRSKLDAYPGRKKLEARLTELMSGASSDHFWLERIGGQLFALEEQPPKQQPVLVVMKDENGAAAEKVVLDPNALDGGKGGTTIDWWVPSPDGKRVAVSLSKGGSESGDLRVYEVATGKELEADRIPRVHGGTAGGSLVWRKDGKAFWYTRYPRFGERPGEDLDFYQEVWFHELGKATDFKSVTAALPRIAECELIETSEDGRFVLLEVKNGDGGEAAFHLLDTQAVKPDPKDKAKALHPWVEVAAFKDRAVGGRLGKDGGLWLRSLKDAPRGKLLRLDPKKPELDKAKVVVPESDAVIQGFRVQKSRLYVLELVGGPNRVRVFDHAGKAQGELPLPAVASVRGMVGLDGDELLLRVMTYTEPPAWWRTKKGKLEKTPLAKTTKADFSGIEVTREMAVSKDGVTKVPINLLRKKGAQKDGKHPTILYGYGGYGVSLTPRFNPRWLPWLEQGGVVAIANLRGGGEFGDAWHEAGKLEKKQNVFDDFVACARFLVDQKWTTNKLLAIEGGSNGGLLMGAAMTQAPDMFGAVVSHVGIYDMLRVETTPNGAFNVTEFGTVKDKKQFDALFAYSPYHQVKNGVKYPPVLFLTGENDPRVDPYHSRKMTARLEAANPSGVVLLRTSANTGHGMGTPLAAQIQEDVDVFSFLALQLGLP